MFTKFGSYAITYCILFLLFFVSVFVISFIPQSFIKHNVKNTILTFSKEGMYPSIGVPWRKIVLDNYTDSLMLNIAYSVDSKKPFLSSMQNKRYMDTADNNNQIANLQKLYDNNATPNVAYERYWHGYLIYLRPLLVIFSYQSIRILNLLCLFGGLLWFLFLTWKQLGKKVAVAFLIGFIAVDFFFIWQSLQFSGVFLIALYAGIYVLKTVKKKQNPYIVFFVVGGLTSFIDLLTAPLITLGMLLILYSLLHKSNVKTVLYYCASWTVGYISLWFTKWLLVDVFISPGAIKTSFNQIVNRTVTEPDPNFSHFNTIKLNFFQLIGYDKRNKIVVLIIGIISAFFVLKYLTINKKMFLHIIPWIVIGLIPYAWYLVAANHSYLHVWYTYRTQFISVVSLILVVAECINWKKVKEDFNFLFHFQKKEKV